ncbi:OprO/OprP family phosphate-selective porin [Sphingomonas kyeonggiensis]|uniref:Phosphate-selective porin OprO/OprP n=1 Tax=Sphingomonas kyeonggiensis TaxID=1268553 RepID=A0A7W6JVR0_9SPHN|nr:porin [Sphingomonas kyeonggiensis]MBB4099362.1 phosphate-selective porin OprO/OprP [Sphingomonas kyeonggiensis]
MQRGALLILGLWIAAPARAQSTDEVARLARLVEAQQAQIARLEARLNAIDAGKAIAVAPPAPQAETLTAAQNQYHGRAPLGQALPSDAHPPSLDARLARIERLQRDGVQVDWSKGTPEFASADGNFTFRPRGRILIDLGTTTGSSVPSRNITATRARSLRLGLEGTIGKHLSYVLEGDFANNDVTIKSAYLAWTTRFLGQQTEFALGNRLNDRGLDGSSGTISVPFLERNVVAQGIIPARGFFGLGAAARVYGSHWHVGVQVSGDDINNASTSSDSRTIAARAHWNPVKTANWLVHLGAWGFNEKIAGDVVRPVRSIAIGGFYNDNLRVLPGDFAHATRGNGYGAEFALFHRTLWASAEAGARDLRKGSGEAAHHSAWSLATGWFLTGETPPYLARGGVWSRPKVLQPVTSGGSGALELAARYEEIDYSDSPLAGRGTAATLGVNWYLNNFTRLQLNAIDWTITSPSGTGMASDHGQSLVGRAQIAF